MELEARNDNCFSSHHVLKWEGQIVGSFQSNWFDENIQVSLLKQRHLEFRRTSWWTSEFMLLDLVASRILSRASSVGWIMTRWSLSGANLAGDLEPLGIFRGGFQFISAGRKTAIVGGLGVVCQNGWLVMGEKPLDFEEMLTIGLVYEIILRRTRRRNHNTTS